MYGQYTRYLERLPTDDLMQAAEIRNFVIKELPLNSAKRFLIRLNACCKWSMRSGRIKSNPFEDMAQEIKLPKAQGKGEDAINPFTAAERDAIIEALESDRFVSPHSGFKHSYYAPYLRFSFLTGCRPSEAVALTWGKVSKDFGSITFDQALIDTSSGSKIREGLKTQERRKFPCNPTLRAFLVALKPTTAKATDLVFPGVRGGYLDPDAFRKSVWVKVLTGLGLEYKKPYQTRHTFINLMLENGLDAKDVARLVGNSPEVIYRHYAGNKRELFVPEV
jgi:integrase